MPFELETIKKAKHIVFHENRACFKVFLLQNI